MGKQFCTRIISRTFIRAAVSIYSKYIKRSPVVKLSQKQHKKLLAKEVEKESPSDRPPTVSAWAVVNNTTDNSLADIMRNTSKAESLQKREGEQAARNFSDIVAEEREKRINFSKMKSKSLYLTQIEDRAIEQLLQFYNASNTYDEHITVERVLSTNIAKPTWINSRNQ